MIFSLVSITNLFPSDLCYQLWWNMTHKEMTRHRDFYDLNGMCRMCQVCERWVEDLEPFVPRLSGIDSVWIRERGLLEHRSLQVSHFPVWGYVDFWEQFDLKMLLCSDGCYNHFLQDPAEVILEPKVNMLLWSSHLFCSFTNLMSITNFLSIWFVLSTFSRGWHPFAGVSAIWNWLRRRLLLYWLRRLLVYNLGIQWADCVVLFAQFMTKTTEAARAQIIPVGIPQDVCCWACGLSKSAALNDRREWARACMSPQSTRELDVCIVFRPVCFWMLAVCSISTWSAVGLIL